MYNLDLLSKGGGGGRSYFAIVFFISIAARSQFSSGGELGELILVLDLKRTNFAVTEHNPADVQLIMFGIASAFQKEVNFCTFPCVSFMHHHIH